MKLQGVVKFMNATFGQKKDGGEWRRIKLLDEDGEEFFVAFVDEEIYASVQGLPKKSACPADIGSGAGAKIFFGCRY